MDTRPPSEQPLRVHKIREGWHVPGYRDPELLLVTDRGNIHIRLSPQAFVELHNALCEQQAIIDMDRRKPMDHEQYPLNTCYKSTRRRV